MRNCFSLIIIIILLAGCKSPKPLNRTSPVKSEIRYSVIYLIHSDADYLYHDQNGTAIQADEKVLKEAQEIGEEALSGEVFIYHLKPERKILWLFPRKDRRLLHYRNGELIAEKKYSPKVEAGLFYAETEYYRRNRAQSYYNPHKILLYFGHEIPPKSFKGYFHSLPNVVVDANSFTKSIQTFLTNEQDEIDLTILSTCNNGTPQMANLLSSFSHFLLASPQNLHLSHIDTKDLQMLENESVEMRDVAIQIAESTFQRMSEELQTAITLTLYNLEKVNSYMSEFYYKYRQHLSKVDYQPFQENTDCTELPIFADLENQDGISRWYQPARFGRRAGNPVHSGWGCKGF